MKEFSFPLKNSSIFFYLLVFIALVMLILIFKPFLGVLMVSLLLATFFHPFYEKLVKIFKGNQMIASFLISLLVTLLIVIPIVFFMGIALDQAISFTIKIVNQFKTGAISLEGMVSDLNLILAKIPFVNYQISGEAIVQKIVENSQLIIQTGTNILVFGSQTAAEFFEQMAVFLFVLFGIFPLLASLKEKIFKLSPLPHHVTKMILNRLYEMGKAVFLGLVLVGLVQSIFGVIGFYLVGVPGIAFWFLVLMFASVIPFIGVGFVIVMVMLYFLIQGEILKLGILFVFYLIATTIDNYLRPLLVGKQTAVHPILLVISLLGGIKLFGISGLLFGPMILVFALTLLEAYEKHYVLKETEGSQAENDN